MPSSTVPASIEPSPLLRFGVFELDRQNRELRKQGRRLRLQEQPFQVLAYLLERAGQAVTRDELRERLWPASVYVDFDHGLNNAIARLREALGDTAAAPQFIETLPRLGYRFIYPVVNPQAAAGTSANDIPSAGEFGSGAAVPPPASGARWTKPRVVAAASIMTALIVFGLLLALWLTRGRVDEAQKVVAIAKAPSIAVLPFVNMSSDPDGEHFADGLTEELLDKLAGIRGLKVVGRTSSFYYKGKQERLPVIAQTLNVNHILEGSVRRSGTRLRITAQLVDAAEGSHLWSQTFDRDLTDIFQIQEDIAFAVAAALQVKLLGTDEQRIHKRGTQDAEAYRLYVIANAHLIGLSVTRDLPLAKQLFERAIDRDPRFAAAYAGLARYHFDRAWVSLIDEADDVRLGLAAAERAVALDPESSVALQARADFAMWRYRFLGDFQAYTQANGDYRRAIQLGPSDFDVFYAYARAVLWNDPPLAQSMFERAAELEPLAIPARLMSAGMLDIRGLHEAAEKRLQALNDGILCCRGRYAIYLVAQKLQLGQLGEAIIYLREAQARGGLEMPVWLWGLYMSLGDRVAAGAALDFGGSELAKSVSEAAGLTMRGHYDEAFKSLDRDRGKFMRSRVLDLPAARLALIAGRSTQALAILRERLPDLYSRVEPVNGHNVIPALDLVAAWKSTGRQARSRELLKRVSDFLDGPAAPQLPLFVYQRARAHVLAGESDMAIQALDRAYAAGFRTTWALDLHPQPFLYIDSIAVDPAFAALRSDQRYQSWLAHIKTDSAHQLEQLKVRDAAKPAG